MPYAIRLSMPTLSAFPGRHPDWRTERSWPYVRQLVPLALALCQLLSCPAQAQDRAEAGLALEEVVVTARKREESLQDTPVAVSAFTSDTLGELGVTDLTRLSTSVPNLQMQQDANGGSAMIACMRGLCRSDTILTEDQMVGVYIDGVANTTAFGTLFELVEVERVEVLRGPQGTLFGKNTLGGAINVITRSPHETMEGEVEVSVGNYGLVAGKAMLNLPLTDTLMAQVAYGRRERDGLIENTAGPDLNDKDNQAARLALRWLPADEVTVDYAGDWYEARQARNPIQFTYIDPGLETVFPGITQIPSPDRLDKRAVIPGADDVNQYSHTLTVHWDFGAVMGLDDLALKSISGKKYAFNDMEGAVSEYYLLAGNTEAEVDTFSQELHLTGSAVDSHLNFVLGLYYADVEGEWRNFFSFITPELRYVQNLQTGAESSAVFADFSFDFTERLSAFAGARYTREDRSAHLDLLNPDGSVLLPVSSLAEADEFDTTNFSPRVGLQYQLTDDVMSYVTLSTGFKSGGLNGRATKPQDFVVYDDAELNSLELGVKSDLFDRRLRLNAALFYQQVDDLQIQVNGLDPETLAFLTQIQNAGKANMLGGELELTWRATEYLDLSLAAGWIDAEYDEFAAFDPATGGVTDVSDERVFQFAPELTLNSTLRYERPLGGLGEFVARLDYSYVDDQSFVVVPESRVAGEAYDLFDLRLELNGIGGSGWSLGGWGKNLTDEEYRIGGYAIATFGIAPPDGLGTNMYGDRRTYGVDIRYQW